MVKPDKDFVIHVASIVSLVIAAHHFWPKGITYGEKEHWEKAYRKRHRLRKQHEEHLKRHPEDEIYSRSHLHERDLERRHYDGGSGGRNSEREREAGRYNERYERVERPRYKDDDGFEYRRQIEFDERPRARH